MKQRGPKFITIIALVLWIIACTLPAYSTYSFGSGIPGWECAFFGPFTLLVVDIFAYIAWSSNALAVFSLILLFNARYILAECIAIIAVICSLIAFPLRELKGIDGPTEIRSVSLGAYVWFSSIIVILVGTIIMRRIARKNSNDQTKLKR